MRKLQPTHVEDQVGLILPSINKKLPHLWREDVATMIAAKSDEAVIPVHFWNQRTHLVYPSFTDEVLQQLRDLVLRYIKQKIRKEFIIYLLDMYPDNAFQYNQQRYRNSDSVCQRLQVCPSTNKNRGFKKINSWMRGSTHPMRMFYPPEWSPHTETKQSFEEDLRAEQQVLFSYMGSSYLEWNAGSSLIFWRWPAQIRQLVCEGVKPYYIHHLPSNKKQARPPPSDHKIPKGNRTILPPFGGCQRSGELY